MHVVGYLFAFMLLSGFLLDVNRMLYAVCCIAVSLYRYSSCRWRCRNKHCLL